MRFLPLNPGGLVFDESRFGATEEVLARSWLRLEHYLDSDQRVDKVATLDLVQFIVFPLVSVIRGSLNLCQRFLNLFKGRVEIELESLVLIIDDVLHLYLIILEQNPQIIDVRGSGSHQQQCLVVGIEIDRMIHCEGVCRRLAVRHLVLRVDLELWGVVEMELLDSFVEDPLLLFLCALNGCLCQDDFGVPLELAVSLDRICVFFPTAHPNN